MNNQAKTGMNAEYVRARYDDFFADPNVDYTYDRWERTPESKYHFAQSLHVFLLALRGVRAEHALEVGCGDGLWTRRFLPHVQHLTCLDISQQMLQRAQQKLGDAGAGVQFQQGDFLRNTFADASFDGILAFRCFEYFEDKQKGIAEFFRLLSPGGTLILVTKSVHFDWRGYFRTRALHQGVEDIPALRRAFKRQGFVVEDIYPAIVGKGLSHPVGRAIGHLLQRFLILTRAFFPLALSRYICESYLFVLRKPNATS